MISKVSKGLEFFLELEANHCLRAFPQYLKGVLPLPKIEWRQKDIVSLENAKHKVTFLSSLQKT